jgi:hypothetical protein
LLVLPYRELDRGDGEGDGFVQGCQLWQARVRSFDVLHEIQLSAAETKAFVRRALRAL